MRFSVTETADFLTTHDSYILTSHESGDADGIGAECALYATLKSMGKRVVVLNSEPVSPKFAYIDKSGIIGCIKDVKDPQSLLDSSTIIILDTNDIYNTGYYCDFLTGHPNSYLIIDHHEPKVEPEGPALIDTTSAATSQIIFNLIAKFKVAISLATAEAMYTGIIYDSGSFSYPKTTEATFSVALELVRIGVNPNLMYHQLNETGTIEALMLYRSVFSTLELHSKARVAVQTMTKETLLQTGALYEDAEHIINTPLASNEVEVSVLFKQNLDGLLRCSLRSKGGVNVAWIAQAFGGGGHKTAAGFKCTQPLEIIKPKVLEKIVESF